MEFFQMFPAILVFGNGAVLPRPLSCPQPLLPGFILLQLSQPGADCFADRLKATLFYLTGDERFKMITEGDGGVSGHVRVPEKLCIKY